MEDQKFLGKKLSPDAELIMWLSSENKKKIDNKNLKFPFVHLNNKIKGKDYDKLIKIAKQCELYYRHKCKNEYINKYCLNCSQTNFHQNDLIRFISIENFLYYMKYMFFVSNNIVAYSKTHFNNNKKEFENIINDFREIKEKWKFKGAKILCKQCMFKLINKPNFFRNIKEILSRERNQTEDNLQMELSEENDINDFNNGQSNKFSKEQNFFILNSWENTKEQNIKKDSNIIINYNNLNNKIFNTIIFNNSYPTFPLIENISNINIEYIKSNYIKSLFISFKNEISEIINILELYKLKQINDINCLSKIQLINHNIYNNFSSIVNAIKTNLYCLNLLVTPYNILEYNSNVVFCMFNCKNMLDLFHRLFYAFLDIENIFIRFINSDISFNSL